MSWWLAFHSITSSVVPPQKLNLKIFRSTWLYFGGGSNGNMEEDVMHNACLFQNNEGLQVQHDMIIDGK